MLTPLEPSRLCDLEQFHDVAEPQVFDLEIGENNYLKENSAV